MKKKFGIIGKPLSHSLSPVLHNYWFKKYEILADYSLIEIKLNDIKTIINKIRTRDLHGINVTVPYKQAVIPFLDTVEGDAKNTLSVNTISLNREEKIVGNNTDVFGFEQGFINKLESISFKETSALILGAGGVTHSIIYALEKKKIGKIFLSNRTIKKAEEIGKKFPNIKIVAWKDMERKIKNVDIVINATSLGLKGGEDFKQQFDKIETGLIYYDVVYNPEETKMIKKFKKKGAKTFNGFEMFIYQGQKSFLIWNETNPDVDLRLKQTILSKLK